MDERLASTALAARAHVLAGMGVLHLQCRSAREGDGAAVISGKRPKKETLPAKPVSQGGLGCASGKGEYPGRSQNNT